MPGANLSALARAHSTSTYSTFQRLMPIGNLYALSFLSQLIYIQQSDGVSGQKLSLHSTFSHLILLQTLHLSLFLSLRLLPCLFGCSLINWLTSTLIPLRLLHTAKWLMPFWGAEKYYGTLTCLWFISYGKWEGKAPLRGGSALTPQSDLKPGLLNLGQALVKYPAHLVRNMEYASSVTLKIPWTFMGCSNSIHQIIH